MERGSDGQIGRLYNKLLAGCPGLVLPPVGVRCASRPRQDVNEKAESNIYWVYGVPGSILRPSRRRGGAITLRAP